MRSLFVVLALVGAAGCATYSDELGRGQAAFEKNDYERALAMFRALEPDQSHFSTQERAHYAYLRGMTDYRIGYKSDARHWLMISTAIDEQNPGSLPSDWKKRDKDTLKDLNDDVFGGTGLTNKRVTDTDMPKHSSSSSGDE